MRWRSRLPGCGGWRATIRRSSRRGRQSWWNCWCARPAPSMAGPCGLKGPSTACQWTNTWPHWPNCPVCLPHDGRKSSRKPSPRPFMYLAENPVLQRELLVNLRMGRAFLLLLLYLGLLGLVVLLAWPQEERLDLTTNPEKSRRLVNWVFLGQY